MQTSAGERILTYGVLGVAAVMALYPLGVIVVTAFGPPDVAVDSQVNPGNFAKAWDLGNLSTYMTNSAVVAVCVVLLSAAVSCLAGYAFGCMTFRGSSVLFYALLIGLMVPSEAIVVPLYYDLRSLELTDTYVSLVFPQVAQSLAFGTFWMRAFFRSSSREVIEAARLDGAGHFRVFWSILLPMGRPAVMTMVLLVFMWTWNEFLLPLVMISQESLRTAPLGLSNFQGAYTQGTALLAAAAVLVALPVLVVFLLTQRHFIRGMVEGSVK